MGYFIPLHISKDCMKAFITHSKHTKCPRRKNFHWEESVHRIRQRPRSTGVGTNLFPGLHKTVPMCSSCPRIKLHEAPFHSSSDPVWAINYSHLMCVDLGFKLGPQHLGLLSLWKELKRDYCKNWSGITPPAS